MLIFCEDCGKKHTVEVDSENSAPFKFRCDECGFLIPVTPPAPAKKEDKELEPDLVLIPSHKRMNFGMVQGNEEKSQMLLVAAGDGRKIDLQGIVAMPLTGNVVLSRVSRMSFMVTVVDPSETATEPVSFFDDIGLELVDTISGAVVEIAIAFERTVPELVVEPSQIDLGSLQAGEQANGSFVISNSGTGTLNVKLVPDPEYFTITTYFSIVSPPQYALVPGQKEEVSFFVKVDPEVQNNESFTQPVLLMSNSLSPNKMGKVVIVGDIIAGQKSA